VTIFTFGFRLFFILLKINLLSIGALWTVAMAKIRHYRQLYINRPEPIAFMPVEVDTTGRIYEDFSRLLFLHAHREASVLANEIPEESEQFRFLRGSCFANIKGSVGLILPSHRLCGSLYRLICHLGLLYHYRVSCGLHHS
jgi:hypothetical protein